MRQRVYPRWLSRVLWVYAGLEIIRACTSPSYGWAAWYVSFGIFCAWYGYWRLTWESHSDQT